MLSGVVGLGSPGQGDPLHRDTTPSIPRAPRVRPLVFKIAPMPSCKRFWILWKRRAPKVPNNLQVLHQRKLPSGSAPTAVQNIGMQSWCAAGCARPPGQEPLSTLPPPPPLLPQHSRLERAARLPLPSHLWPQSLSPSQRTNLLWPVWMAWVWVKGRRA